MKGNIESSKFPAIGGFFEDLADAILQESQINKAQLMTTLLSYASAVIGGRAFVYNGAGKALKPNIWSLIIAPSSTASKSTSLEKAGFSLLRRIEKESQANFDEQKKRHGEISRRIHKDKKGKEDAGNAEPEIKKPERFYLDFGAASSFEGMIYKMQVCSYGGIRAYGEITDLLYRCNKDHALKAALTDIYDGRPYTKQLVGSEGTGVDTHIPSPCLSIIGVTNPQWLISNANIDDIRSGLYPRFGMVVLEKEDVPLLKAFEHSEPVDYSLFQDTAFELLKALGWSLPSDKQFVEPKEPREIELSPDAKSRYKLWFDGWMVEHKDEPSLGAFAVRQGNAALKYALIMSLFDKQYKGLDPFVPITPDIMLRAIALAEYYLSQSRRFIELLSDSKAKSQAERLLEYIARQPKAVTPREIKQNSGVGKPLPQASIEAICLKLVAQNKLVNVNGAFRVA